MEDNRSKCCLKLIEEVLYNFLFLGINTQICGAIYLILIKLCHGNNNLVYATWTKSGMDYFKIKYN